MKTDKVTTYLGSLASNVKRHQQSKRRTNSILFPKRDGFNRHHRFRDRKMRKPIQSGGGDVEWQKSNQQLLESIAASTWWNGKRGDRLRRRMTTTISVQGGKKQEDRETVDGEELGMDRRQ